MLFAHDLRRTTAITTLITISLAVPILVSCADLPPHESETQEGETDHPMSGVVDGFHLYSYYAGSAFTAAEFVGSGSKKLALSAPYTTKQLEHVIEPTRMAAEQYGVPMYVEDDLLITSLFDPAIAEGKTVIMMAYTEDVLEDYHALKELRKTALAEGRLDESDEEIAWKFGRLLSYSDETIERLLSESHGGRE